MAHIARYSEWAWGPIQRDDALLLFALARNLRPATVVEIGFLFGHSAFNFLRALDADARLYSFDVDPIAVEHARRLSRDPRFVFRNKSQDTIDSADVDGRKIDLVFLDGAHDLAVNQLTLQRLEPLLAERALVVIHDTGAIARQAMPIEPLAPGNAAEHWVGDEFEHQPDERAFVNWLQQEHPDFAQIHLHSRRVFRHGMTLLQRSAPLPRPARGPSAGRASLPL